MFKVYSLFLGLSLAPRAAENLKAFLAPYFAKKEKQRSPAMRRKASSAGLPFNWWEYDHKRRTHGAEAALVGIRPGFDYSRPIDGDRDTALGHALRHKDFAAARRFIDCGAPVSQPDKEGIMPLTSAAMSGDAAIAAFLLENGADVNDAGPSGYSALAAAAERNSIEMIRLLIAAGADVEKTSEDGTTPLMSAAGEGRLEAVQALLIAGANPCRQNQRGHTAADIAFRHNAQLPDVAALLGAAMLEWRRLNGEAPIQTPANDSQAREHRYYSGE